jgi:hypothetical protein
MAVTLKVTSLSAIVSTNPQRTAFDEEKEKERIFPSTFSHIQNHMVITQKHMLFMIRTSRLLIWAFLATPLVIFPLSLYPPVCFECIALCMICIDISHHAFPSFFVDNDDNDD